MSENNASSRAPIQVLTRSDTVLLALARSPVPLGTRDLARLCGLAVSTTHRILTGLESIGFSKHTPKGKWQLDEKLLFLGLCAQRQNAVPSLEEPALDALREKTGAQKVLLCWRIKDRLALCTRGEIRDTALHDSLCGIVFLASDSPEKLISYMTRNRLTGLKREAILLAKDRLNACGWLQSPESELREKILAAPLYTQESSTPNAVLALVFEAGSPMDPNVVEQLLSCAKSLRKTL